MRPRCLRPVFPCDAGARGASGAVGVRSGLHVLGPRRGRAGRHPGGRAGRSGRRRFAVVRPMRPFRRMLCSLGALLLALPLTAGWAATARIYVSNSAGDSIHVIDPQSNKVVQIIRGIEAPHGIGFSPDGARVYVSNEADSTLDVVDTRRLALTHTIPVHGRQHNVYVTPDGRYAVAGSVRDKMLTVVDLATESVAWELPFATGVRPMAFEAAADGVTQRIFVQLSRLNGFAVVDFAARREVTRVEFPGELNAFGEAEGRLDTPSHGIAVAPDGKSLWVTSVLANAVFRYSLPDLKLMGHAALPEIRIADRKPIGALPDWLAFTPDSRLVYVSNSGANSVSAIDAASLKVIATIPVGEVPKRMNTLVLR